MGCDIHTLVERPRAGSWQIVPNLNPFDWRSYGVFGFLADVRNYSAVPVITPRRGIPNDCADPERFEDLHSCSWLLIAELMALEGGMTTFREFLREAFFDDIRKLQDIAPDGRVVFGFDN